MAVQTEEVDNQPPNSSTTPLSHNVLVEDEPEDNDNEDDDDDAEEDDDEEATSSSSTEPSDRLIRDKMTKLVNRMRSAPVALRVHDVIIKGNLKTKDSVIEAVILDDLKRASTLQEIFQAAAIADLKLRQLDIFDSVNFTLDAGPKELPGTTNVIIMVSETTSPLTGQIGMYTKPGVYLSYFNLIN